MASSAQPKLLYITGTDQHMFGPTCCLLASIWHRLPGEKLYVADFGLLPYQRDVFAKLGVLLDMPDIVRNQFPSDMPTDRPDLALAWYSKASLLEYVRGKEFDALAWIDADIIVTGELGPQAEQLAARMGLSGQSWAAASCAPTGSLEDFIARHLNDPQRNVNPFVLAIDQLKIVPALVYLNSGFFIARDRDALARWRYLTCTLPSHFLFEQNAFNIAAYMEPEKLELLSAAQWNLNGPGLAEARVDIVNGLPRVRYGETECLLVHATSPNASDAYVQDHSFAGSTDRFRMKWFGNSELRILQQYYLDEFAAYAGLNIPATAKQISS